MSQPVTVLCSILSISSQKLKPPVHPSGIRVRRSNPRIGTNKALGQSNLRREEPAGESTVLGVNELLVILGVSLEFTHQSAKVCRSDIPIMHFTSLITDSLNTCSHDRSQHFSQLLIVRTGILFGSEELQLAILNGILDGTNGVKKLRSECQHITSSGEKYCQLLFGRSLHVKDSVCINNPLQHFVSHRG